MSSLPLPTPYDTFPYVSLPYRASHPDRLSLLAYLFRLSPAPATCCRVLELACSAGGNLLPMAAALPRSTFVGVDLAATAIASARECAAALSLTNIEFHHADLAALPDTLGTFDYIIAHGVYSWVPPETQRALLDLFARALAPHGVAFVSHNAYPGWSTRQTVRAMMLYQSARFEGLEKQLEQSRALVEFVVEHAHATQQGYRQQLAGELAILRDKPAWYLRHDHLGEHNSAVYLHELVGALRDRGLEFLADADFATMFPNEFAPEVEATLHRICADVTAMEQHLDFLRNRVFRQTLVCRAEAPVVRDLRGEQALSLFVASRALPAATPAEITEGVPVTFRLPAGGPTLGIERAATKTALIQLHSAWPRALPFTDLDPQGEPARLGTDLLRCYAKGLVDLSLRASDFTTTPGSYPRSPPLVRWQATRGTRVTNLRHESIELAALPLRTLALLDGTSDRDALRRALGASTEEIAEALSVLAREALLVD
ncbi:methyltransferase regulatory domain-containing protein [Sorangium sp. So ce1335]|uniref:methyltransferase regulatory domain-containing protein n=1 Tax=Sorangium sp. So ce1335 TaxID=3133335 RepID=UPI003F62752B